MKRATLGAVYDAHIAEESDPEFRDMLREIQPKVVDRVKTYADELIIKARKREDLDSVHNAKQILEFVAYKCRDNAAVRDALTPAVADYMEECFLEIVNAEDLSTKAIAEALNLTTKTRGRRPTPPSEKEAIFQVVCHMREFGGRETQKEAFDGARRLLNLHIDTKAVESIFYQILNNPTNEITRRVAEDYKKLKTH